MGERRRERRRERREQAGRGGTMKGTAKGEAGKIREGSGGRGKNRISVSRECANIQDGLRVGQCQLDSAPTTSVTGVTVDWRQHCRGCHRPTWTWEYSKKRN